jgi:hypothetical protein
MSIWYSIGGAILILTGVGLAILLTILLIATICSVTDYVVNRKRRNKH